jgi:hypothetical protein
LASSRAAPFAYQFDKEGKPSHPYGAYTKVEGGGRIIVLSEGMASLFLGDPKAVLTWPSR